MSLTTIRMALEDSQARTKNIELNEFIVRGGLSPYKSIKLVTSIILMVIVLSYEFLIPPLMKGLSHYIAPFGPSWSYTC